MHHDVIETLENRTLLAFPVAVGGGGFDYGTASAHLADGGVIVAGVFSGTVQFDPNGTSSATRLSSAGESDAFAAKYDAAGNLVWVRQFGGVLGDLFIDEDRGEAVDAAINPRRAGGEFFTNGVGADPRGAGEYINSIAVTAGGDIYLTGGFLGTVDFDPGPAQRRLTSIDKDFYDMFIVKLNSAGNMIWANQWGGRFTDMGNEIALDSRGNLYLTGVFTREVDFDLTRGVTRLMALGRADAFVLKLTGGGRLIWVAQLGGLHTSRDALDAGNGIAVDSAGNVYVAGTFAGDCFFKLNSDTTSRFLLRAAGGTDAFVAKLDSSGQLVWFRPTGGREFDGAVSFALAGSLSSPDVITAGYFEETITVGPGPGAGTLNATPSRTGRSPDHTDLLISRWDNTGSLIWAKPIAGRLYETVGRIAVDASRNIYITGGFAGRVDFDPGTSQFNLSSTDLPFEINDRNERRRDRQSSYDIFFASLNINGRFRFARRIGGSDDDFALALSRPQTGQSASVFSLTGRFAGSVNFDPSGSALRSGQGRSDLWAALFDTNGNLL